jgi:dipeptidyl aminopeptidase
MAEMLPPFMDTSGRTKYPVLFKPFVLRLVYSSSSSVLTIHRMFRYGGPASQQVSAIFKKDWHDHLAGSLEYIVVTIDGRGTGFRGRSFRSPVRGQLGRLEAQDQIEAARLARHFFIHLLCRSLTEIVLEGNMLSVLMSTHRVSVSGAG